MTLQTDMMTLFLTCAVVVLWVYLGYPAALALGFFGERKEVNRETLTPVDGLPLVSVVVAAHNEESNIEEKLKNLLASDYPPERMEILVGSDGSSDRTEEIVRRFDANAVGLISFPHQQGKSAMQNRLVAATSGSVLVFTDADSTLDRSALRLLAENFNDPQVGLATAHPRYLDASRTEVGENEDLYFRYEGWLREQESARGMLSMASGPLFAMRRSLWAPLDVNLGDDFVLPLRSAKAGMRNVLDARIRVAMPLAQDRAGSLFAMKVRIVSKDLRGLIAHAELLNPFRYGRLAVGLCSHKLLRWLVPYFLIGAFGSNLFLWDRRSFTGLMALQAGFYVAALAGFILRDRVGSSLFGRFVSIPFSFCLVNLAALLGTLKCVVGKTSGQWKPVRKHSPAS